MAVPPSFFVHPPAAAGETRAAGGRKGRDPDGEERHERTGPVELLGRRPDLRALALLGLLFLAGCYSLYFARPVLLPVVLGILVSFVLHPVVGALERLHVPRVVGAGLVLAGLLAGSGYGVYRLAGPASEWIAEAPRNFRQLEEKLGEIKQPVEEVERATQEVERIARIGGEAGGQDRVTVSEPSLGDRIVRGTREFLASGVVMIVLLYFLLASGDMFIRKLARVLPTLREKRRAVLVVREVRAEVSTYLLTLSSINLGLGAAVAGAMWALLAPAAYLVLNTVEGSLVTPAVMGRRLALNPVAVFLGLLFWGWIWGIPGP